MQKFQCLLFVLKQSCTCCYLICMTVPLRSFRKIDTFPALCIFSCTEQPASIENNTTVSLQIQRRMIEKYMMEIV